MDTSGTTKDPRSRNLAIGTLLLLGGVFCILAPLVTGIAIAYLVGAAMVIAGGSLLLSALGGDALWLARGANAALGLLLIVFGVIVFLDPVASLAALTVLLGIWMLATGVVVVAAAFGTDEQWLGLLVGGISIVLGVLIFAEWPLSGDWAVGVLLGVQLIVLAFRLLTAPATDPQRSR